MGIIGKLLGSARRGTATPTGRTGRAPRRGGTPAATRRGGGGGMLSGLLRRKGL